MKLMTITLMVLAVLLATGCATPRFNDDDIVFINKTQSLYHAPYSTLVQKELMQALKAPTEESKALQTSLVALHTLKNAPWEFKAVSLPLLDYKHTPLSTKEERALSAIASFVHQRPQRMKDSSLVKALYGTCGPLNENDFEYSQDTSTPISVLDLGKKRSAQNERVACFHELQGNRVRAKELREEAESIRALLERYNIPKEQHVPSTFERIDHALKKQNIYLTSLIQRDYEE